MSPGLRGNRGGRSRLRGSPNRGNLKKMATARMNEKHSHVVALGRLKSRKIRTADGIGVLLPRIPPLYGTTLWSAVARHRFGTFFSIAKERQKRCRATALQRIVFPPSRR